MMIYTIWKGKLLYKQDTILLFWVDQPDDSCYNTCRPYSLLDLKHNYSFDSLTMFGWYLSGPMAFRS